MPGRVFKEKQLRLCVVAALTSLSAPVAESLLLPPKPLASNLTWRCDSGLAQKRLCNTSINPNHRYARNTQQPKQQSRPVNSERVTNQTIYSQAIYSQENEQPDSLESNKRTAPSNSLLTLSGDQYVLQWMAAKERGQLEALKQRYPVLKSALIARYERSGNVWFVLLDGPFRSRADAMAELGAPPRSAMASELYPWTRSLASIQRLNPIVSDPSYRIAENRLQDSVEELASRSTPLLATTEQNAPYFNQPYVETRSYNPEIYPSQQVEVVAKRQSDSDRSDYNIYYQQQNNQQEIVLPYGSEFEENGVLEPQNNKSIVIYQDSPTVSSTYTQTSSASNSKYAARQIDQDIDYNLQNSGQSDYQQATPVRSKKPVKMTAQTVQRQYATNVLTANPQSYTIEWMSSNRKASLERAQLRYSELQNTQIVRYTRNNRQRYLLVSMLFVNRSDAMDALLTPSLARISARFSPKIRLVADVQTLVGNTSQGNNAWVGPTLEPEIQKRHWIGTQDPGDREYIVQRRIEPQRSTAPVTNAYSTLPQTVTAQVPAPKANPRQEQLNALLNTPGDAYTIQWFSSHNLKSIEQLKQRFPQLRDAMTVQVKKDNRQWFVLVQGQYRNSQEAIRALKTPSMKTIAMVLHPWTRPVDSLKKLSVATL